MAKYAVLVVLNMCYLVYCQRSFESSNNVWYKYYPKEKSWRAINYSNQTLSNLSNISLARSIPEFDGNVIYKNSHQQAISRSRLRSLELAKRKSKVNSLNKKRQKTKGFERKLETTKGIDILIGGSNEEISHSNYTKAQNDMQLIFVGTKWCGAGDIAKSKRDVGYFSLTDSCCRDHDLCPDYIIAKESKYGLKNTGRFTRSHCECDSKFYDCLKRVDSLISNQLGVIYFNVLGPQCFIEEHPYECEHLVRGRCVKYGRELEKEKIYQWLDNKWY